MNPQRKVIPLESGEVALAWADGPDALILSLPDGWMIETVFQASPENGRDHTKIRVVRNRAA